VSEAGGDAKTTTTATGSGSTTVPAGDRDSDTAGEAAAREVVDRYVASVGTGDLDAAWDLLDPRSREVVGDRSDFEAMATDLAEGIGAWSAAPDRTAFVHRLGAAAGSDAWAVTLRGTVAQEGPPALGSASMVVYTGASGATVSPFEDPFGEAGFPFFDPVEGSEVDQGRAIVFGLPVGFEPALVTVDDRVVTAQSLSTAGADGETRNYAIADPGWAAGPHVVTVAVEAGGARTAISAAYLVSA
jgi:hypothetical protein